MEWSLLPTFLLVQVLLEISSGVVFELPLEIAELDELVNAILDRLPNEAYGAIARANRTGELEELLRLIGMDDLLVSDRACETYRSGKILVLGYSQIGGDKLLGVVRKLGIDPSRIDFHLGYEAAKNFNYRKLRYASNYRVVLTGPMPHSTSGTGESGSVIIEMEKYPKIYPRVERLTIWNGKLKITKSNFRAKLLQLLNEGYI